MSVVHKEKYRRLDKEEKMSNAYPKELRERVIQEWLDGASKAAAARFKVGYATARRWIDRYQATGSYLPFPDSGGKSTQKIFEEHEQAILSWIRDNLAGIGPWAKSQGGLSGSISSTTRCANVWLDWLAKPSPSRVRRVLQSSRLALHPCVQSGAESRPITPSLLSDHYLSTEAEFCELGALTKHSA